MNRANATPAWARCVAAGFSMLLLCQASLGREVSLLSPNQGIEVTVSEDARGQLTYAVALNGNTVVDTSTLGITIDGQDLGVGVAIRTPAQRTIREHYAWRGVKSQALNHCQVYEIPREGIREQEYLLWGQLPLTHYGALPFTRMVAGHGDFLPTYVREQYLKNTTAVFQLATAVIYVSPFICWPDHPEAYLESPFLPLLRTMPPVWDETRVLKGSKLGSLVAFTRRSGTDWYVAVLNCQAEEIQYSIPLDFLDEGEYEATLYYDGTGTPGSTRVETTKRAQIGSDLSLVLRQGGGFVARFSKPSVYTK